MNKYLLLHLVGLTATFCTNCTPQPSVRIEEAIYENRPHYVVHTPTATYWYDQAGGGLSRLLDQESNDWISFKQEPLASYPASAAAGFRGLPNFVFQSEESGAGHPGFEQCRSEVLDGYRIRSRSLSGTWQWTWTFHDSHASVTMEQVDPDHAYWFLYEGTPAGIFSPATQYWGTDAEGYHTHNPDYYAGERATGHWQWAYFGDSSNARVLFVGMVQLDTHEDLLGFLGNTEAGLSSADGMVVFGFGRKQGAIPLMTAEDNTFVIGFLDQQVSSKETHGILAEKIHSVLSAARRDSSAGKRQ